MDRGVTVFSSRIERSQLKSGDHIYAWRKSAAKIYSHHGIYESDERVIQLTSALPLSFIPDATCRRCREAMRAGGVVICCLGCFLRGDELRLFAYAVPLWFFALSNASSRPHLQLTCTTEAEDPPETVLRRANDLLAHGFGTYNLVLKNCLDFAFFCKTGRCYYGLVRPLLLIDWVGEPEFLRKTWGAPQGQ